MSTCNTAAIFELDEEKARRFLSRALRRHSGDQVKATAPGRARTGD